MANTEILHLDNETADRLRAYAAEVGMDPDAMAMEAMTAGLATLRRLRFFQPRDPDVDISDAVELLERAGDEDPLPGDELPEGYRQPN